MDPGSRRLHRDRSPEARIPNRTACAGADSTRTTSSGPDEKEATDERRPKELRTPKGHRRARIRSNQAGARFPAVPAPRARASAASVPVLRRGGRLHRRAPADRRPRRAPHRARAGLRPTARRAPTGARSRPTRRARRRSRRSPSSSSGAAGSATSSSPSSRSSRRRRGSTRRRPPSSRWPGSTTAR